jgi:hypothetical protein
MIIENAIAQLNYLIRNEDDQLLATRLNLFFILWSFTMRKLKDFRLIESSRPIMLTRPAPEREPLRSKPPQKSASMNVIGPIVTHKNRYKIYVRRQKKVFLIAQPRKSHS